MYLHQMMVRQRIEDFVYDHPTLAAFAIATFAISILAVAFSLFTGAVTTHYLHNDVSQVAFHPSTSNAKIGCLYA